MAKEFTGKIEFDIRDSTPDWDAFLADKAPEGAPNVLVILYDDTGLAAWSPYGGRIEMPTMQKLADNGLTYSQWHTTALCSPTRSTFLTGRNHHQNGFTTISESAKGYPGYNSHIPRECASIATVLRNAGWSTVWIGKNHNIPVDVGTMGSSKKDWPLGQATTASTASSAARRTSGSRTSPRTTTTSISPTARTRGTTFQGPGRQGDRVHPRLEAGRARQAVVTVVLSGREPCAAPRAPRLHRGSSRSPRRFPPAASAARSGCRSLRATLPAPAPQLRSRIGRPPRLHDYASGGRRSLVGEDPCPVLLDADESAVITLTPLVRDSEIRGGSSRCRRPEPSVPPAGSGGSSGRAQVRAALHDLARDRGRVVGVDARSPRVASTAR
jgi:hypothetical protein